jgi:MOSC domain-containing protein YiiM
MATVLHIFVASEKGAPMRSLGSVRALPGAGLEGDRYATASGSWNAGKPGNRQVSIISLEPFLGTAFSPEQSRRNIIVEGIETPSLIGKTFVIGSAILRGVKYCTVCNRPDDLSGKTGFKEIFRERGGILAEVIEGGEITAGDEIIVA